MPAAMSVWLRRGATAVAAGRVGVGLVALAAPGVLARSWAGAVDRPSSRVASQVLGRALGARDLALGLGTLAALRPQSAGTPSSAWAAALSAQPGKPDLAAAAGRAAGVWVGLAALADGLDLVTTVLSWRQLPSPQRWLITLSSGGAAAVGAAAAISLVTSPPA